VYANYWSGILRASRKGPVRWVPPLTWVPGLAVVLAEIKKKLKATN